MENEIMNYDTIEEIGDIVEVKEGAGIGTGAAILIGVGLACAIGAGVKLVKKVYAAYKTKKELKQPNDEVQVLDEDLVDVSK